MPSNKTGGYGTGREGGGRKGRGSQQDHALVAGRPSRAAHINKEMEGLVNVAGERAGR